MARTASSLASPSVTSAISLHMARLTALRILGRLKTTVAMPPSRSTRISSLMPLPLCASSRSPPPRCRPREGQSSGGVRELQFLSAESLWRQRVSSGILVYEYDSEPSRAAPALSARPGPRGPCRRPHAHAGGAGRAGVAGVLLSESRRHQGRRGCPRRGEGDRARAGVLLHLGPDRQGARGNARSRRRRP